MQKEVSFYVERRLEQPKALQWHLYIPQVWFYYRILETLRKKKKEIINTTLNCYNGG